jgi:hypothetical protein
VHEVPVQAHGYPGAGVAGADLVLLAVDGDVPVALDLAVDLDRLPGGQRRLARLVALRIGTGGRGAT